MSLILALPNFCLIMSFTFILFNFTPSKIGESDTKAGLSRFRGQSVSANLTG